MPTYKCKHCQSSVPQSASTTSSCTVCGGAEVIKSIDTPSVRLQRNPRTNAVTAHVSDIEQGAWVYYTTDGTTPSRRNGSVYTISTPPTFERGHSAALKCVAILGAITSEIVITQIN